MEYKGIRFEVGQYGDALTLKVWMQGVACYGIFCSIEGVYAWLDDNGLALDKRTEFWLDIAA